MLISKVLVGLNFLLVLSVGFHVSMEADKFQDLVDSSEIAEIKPITEIVIGKSLVCIKIWSWEHSNWTWNEAQGILL